MTTQRQARDAVMDRINTAWLASATTQSLPIVWDDVDGSKPGYDTDGKAVAWARVTMRHQAGSQETMANVGQRRYAATGLVTVQIFTPIGDGLVLSDAICAVVKSMFRARPRPQPVWFRDITPTEIGPDGPWQNVNVSAVFQYQERE